MEHSPQPVFSASSDNQYDHTNQDFLDPSAINMQLCLFVHMHALNSGGKGKLGSMHISMIHEM